MSCTPSETFLFDNYNTGRLKYSLGRLSEPEFVWKYSLRSYPSHAPESSPIFDKNGNIYFGAHAGCFYSLTYSGRLRWMFKTGGKIYSSPAVIDNLGVFAASADGYLYSFDTDEGKLRWTYYLSEYDRAKGRLGRKIQAYQFHRKMYDPDRKKKWQCKVWASPKITSDNCILITGFGKGLHAVDAVSGKTNWLFKMGGIQYHRSGVALGQEQEIYVAAHQRFLYSVTSDGDLKWHYDTKMKYVSWGAPSVDVKAGTVYFPLACREKEGIVFAMDLKGRMRWKQKISGAVRGSVTVCYDDYVAVCGFDGVLYFLSKNDGTIKHSLQITTAERGLWTTASVDLKGNLFLTSKDSRKSGSVYCISRSGEIKWRYQTGKALSTPVIDSQSRLYFGTWEGEFICLQT